MKAKQPRPATTINFQAMKNVLIITGLAIVAALFIVAKYGHPLELSAADSNLLTISQASTIR